MANGSRRWFRYVSNDGTAYAVELDESNSEATLGGAALFTSINGSEGLKPGRLKMRYVNTVQEGNPLIRKKFWVGNASVLAAANAQTPVVEGTIRWFVTSSRGEQSVTPTLGDTGQTDGDNP